MNSLIHSHFQSSMPFIPSTYYLLFQSIRCGRPRLIFFNLVFGFSCDIGKKITCHSFVLINHCTAHRCVLPVSFPVNLLLHRAVKNPGHALGISIAGAVCLIEESSGHQNLQFSIASKSAGAKDDVPKIYGFVNSLNQC